MEHTKTNAYNFDLALNSFRILLGLSKLNSNTPPALQIQLPQKIYKLAIKNLSIIFEKNSNDSICL